MPWKTDYITPSELDSDSGSEWCESGSDPEWEDPGTCPGQKSKKPASGQKNKAKTLTSVPAASLVPAPPSTPTAYSVPPLAPFVPAFQHPVPNDHYRYPDLPDYMPYMPSCVPHPSPETALPFQSFQLTVDQMNVFMQQQNGDLQLPGFQDLGQPGLAPGRSQGNGGHDFSKDKSLQAQGAAMNLQQGFKKEDQPGNDSLPMNFSGLGFWFDPSASQIPPQLLPQPFEGHGFNFDFKAAMPFALSVSESVMDRGQLAPCGGLEPAVNAEHNSSKTKASSNHNANTIPLLCILCEKTPKFSDVSHLLTHISSKGHLSRRFHLELQAQTDENVQQRLLQFEIWFEQHGIQQLLKTRQEAKDQKKRTQVRRQRGVGNENNPRRSSTAREALKSELDDDLSMPASHLNPLNQQNWHQSIPLDNVFQTPSNKRNRSVYPVPDSPDAVSHHNDEPTETGKQVGSRTPTLKGIVHAGMGIFDAATPEMKRIRNQRKHPSVLNNMVLVSESISMTEQVWNESMTKIEHERNVYDTPTDLSSPGYKDDDDDEPPPKKPRGSHAATKSNALTSERLTRSATRAMNVGLTRASRRGKRGGGNRGGTKRGGGKKVPKIEDEDLDSGEELDIRRGKRNLSVFQDASRDDGSLGDVFGGRPQGAQAFGGGSFGSQQAGFPPRTAMQGLPSNRPLSSMYGRTDNHQFIMYDKENDRNAFSSLPGYYQPRQNMQSGAFNPLFVQRQDNFANVYGQGFDPLKPSNPAFQSMNGIVYNGMHGGMNNGLSNEFHSGFSSDMNQSLNNSLENNVLDNSSSNGSLFRPGNNGGQSNGFDIQ